MYVYCPYFFEQNSAKSVIQPPTEKKYPATSAYILEYFWHECKSSISLRSCELEKWKLWVTTFFFVVRVASVYHNLRSKLEPYGTIGHKNWIGKKLHRSKLNSRSQIILDSVFD